MKIQARLITRVAAMLGATLLLGACSTPQLGVSSGKFQACSFAPHCVSSTESDPKKYIAPIEVNTAQEWQRLQALVLAMPRTKIAVREVNYLHAVTSTDIMGYKDDVELLYTPAKNAVDIRSSSRVGYYDFGINRARLEQLRSQLNGVSSGQEQ
ncbi:DUF1499 domain-containing protein [Zhongshania sp.]|jgi:uncharacterized protein (DUF1499 family)|uniref:DUF1499 domain-containing protein n=1 Tax=Zhongshania sp. TaxID=1971902 RepID=UPI0039E2A78B